MIFYHRTRNAEAILRDGFRDEEGSYGMEDFTLRGGFFQIDRLMTTRVPEEIIYSKSLPDDCCDFSYNELVEEGKPYREWCIPAQVINRHGTVRPATTE
jgi:hypothetical protein